MAIVHCLKSCLRRDCIISEAVQGKNAVQIDYVQAQSNVLFLACVYQVQGELLKSPWSSTFASMSASHCFKVLYASFLEVHISATTEQKAFIFGP